MSFTYDALGRLRTQTNPAGTVEATWDLAGRRTRIKWPDLNYVDYDYLVTGEMSAVRFNGATSGANVLATYSYDQLGRRSSIGRGNGTSTSYGYDAVSRLDTLSHDLAGTTHDVSYGYAYNHAGQIVSVTRSNDLYAWTKHGSGTTSTTANGLNQIASWNATVTHDAKGNITSDGTNSYSYSSENLMTGVTVPPWGSDTIAYDPLMRVRGTGSQQRFLRFQDDVLAEYYGTTLVERFIPGAGEDETTATLNRFDLRGWYYADERGSTVGKAGDAGTATIYSYDEYGRPGTTQPPRMGNTGQMQFITDQVYDYKNRMYHPALGRFLQPDRIGYASGMNLYAYVKGDPVNRRDPLGLGDVDLGSVDVEGCPEGYYKNIFWNLCVSRNLELIPNLVSFDGFGWSLINNITGEIVQAGEKLKEQVCSASQTVKDYQKNAKGTLQLGLAGSTQAGPGGLLGGAGFAFDAKGNVGLYSYTGFAGGGGFGGSGSLSVQGSNASSIEGLNGAFWNVSGHLADGPAFSLDAFGYRDTLGGGYTFGAGSGAYVQGGVTYTQVIKLGNPLTDVTNILDALGQCQ